MGETYLEVDGQWCSLSRAIDRDGTRVEALLSEQRDRAAAQRFFAHALDAAGHASAQVTTAGYDADSRAIREALGKDVTHRTSRDKNNRIAQDLCGIKQRYSPLCGFGRFASAARCGTGFAEQRQYCRLPTNRDERVALAAQRRFQVWLITSIGSSALSLHRPPASPLGTASGQCTTGRARRCPHFSPWAPHSQPWCSESAEEPSICRTMTTLITAFSWKLRPAR